VAGFDVSVPSTARMYDYWLGGQDNFAADRAAALRVEESAPGARFMAIENRRFLQRAVRFLAASGVRQFLDVGTGLPTRGNVHEVAQGIDSGSRVVYVDNDPMVLAHSRALKTGAGTLVVQADLRAPEVILARAAGLLDFTEPVAVLLVAVLHFVGEDDKPAGCVSALMDAVPDGSWLAVSHVTGEFSADGAARSAAEYRAVTPGATVRSRSQVLRFFDGLELAEPGLVRVTEWRPDEPFTGALADVWFLGGAGRKSTCRP
jgi:hypothetical protein